MSNDHYIAGKACEILASISAIFDPTGMEAEAIMTQWKGAPGSAGEAAAMRALAAVTVITTPCVERRGGMTGGPIIHPPPRSRTVEARPRVPWSSTADVPREYPSLDAVDLRKYRPPHVVHEAPAPGTKVPYLDRPGGAQIGTATFGETDERGMTAVAVRVNTPQTDTREPWERTAEEDMGLRVSRPSAHHVQFRSAESGRVEADWWPSSGRLRIHGCAGIGTATWTDVRDGERALHLLRQA